MKRKIPFICALAFATALNAVASADYTEASTDAGTWDTGAPFSSSIVIDAGDGVANEFISDLTVTVNMEHSWVGDVTATLTHQETGATIDLIGAALSDSSNLGSDSGGDTLSPALYTFSDAGVEDIATASAAGDSSYEIPAGTYLADGGVSFATIFGGDGIYGTWILDLSDSAGGDDGNIDGWSVSFTSAIPEPGSLTLLGFLGVAAFIRRRR